MADETFSVEVKLIDSMTPMIDKLKRELGSIGKGIGGFVGGGGGGGIGTSLIAGELKRLVDGMSILTKNATRQLNIGKKGSMDARLEDFLHEKNLAMETHLESMNLNFESIKSVFNKIDEEVAQIAKLFKTPVAGETADQATARMEKYTKELEKKAKERQKANEMLDKLSDEVNFAKAEVDASKMLYNINSEKTISKHGKQFGLRDPKVYNDLAMQAALNWNLKNLKTGLGTTKNVNFASSGDIAGSLGVFIKETSKKVWAGFKKVTSPTIMSDAMAYLGLTTISLLGSSITNFYKAHINAGKEILQVQREAAYALNRPMDKSLSTSTAQLATNIGGKKWFTEQGRTQQDWLIKNYQGIHDLIGPRAAEEYVKAVDEYAKSGNLDDALKNITNESVVKSAKKFMSQGFDASIGFGAAFSSLGSGTKLDGLYGESDVASAQANRNLNDIMQEFNVKLAETFTVQLAKNFGIDNETIGGWRNDSGLLGGALGLMAADMIKNVVDAANWTIQAAQKVESLFQHSAVDKIGSIDAMTFQGAIWDQSKFAPAWNGSWMADVFGKIQESKPVVAQNITINGIPDAQGVKSAIKELMVTQ